MKQIVGTLLTTSFTHQSDPETAKTKRANGAQVNGQISAPVYDGNRERHIVPYITGNSVRGQLRRAGAEMVLKALHRPVSRELFSILTCGKVGRGAIGFAPTATAVMNMDKDPFAGLFGGGCHMLRSAFTIGQLWPEVAWCLPLLHRDLRDAAIPDEKLRGTRKQLNDEGKFVDVPYPVKLVHDVLITSRDDLLNGKGASYVEDYENALEAWQKEVSDGNAAKAADKKAAREARAKNEPYHSEGSKSSDNRMISGIESIVPGTPLQFWIMLENDPDGARLGLLLMAIRDFANTNRLGGGAARGFGRFQANLALYEDDRLIVPSIFDPNTEAPAYTLVKDLNDYVAKAQAGLDALTVDMLDVTYGLPAWRKKQEQDAQKALKKAKGKAKNKGKGKDKEDGTDGTGAGDADVSEAA
ncbi:MAG TPA: type IV CRISPR-associated protein Csf2 [Nevskiaceae bacterium]|nr:type IV CRISPR-associated protein Csf2 [Nevskiaceae bacterium]